MEGLASTGFKDEGSGFGAGVLRVKVVGFRAGGVRDEF